MKSFLTVSVFIAATLLLLLSGCELYTPASKGPGTTVGTDLIISEVFPLSPTNFYSFSWIELYNPTNRYISTINITTPISGYAIGSNGTLLKTTDDGETWNNIAESPFAGNFNAMAFPWPDTGFGVGDGGIIFRINRLKSDSGHYRFTDIHTNLPAGAQGHSLRAIEGQLQVPVIFACGDGGVLLRSYRLGNPGTWTQYTGVTTKNLYGMRYVRSDALYAVGDSATILRGGVGGNYRGQIAPFAHSLGGIDYRGVAFSSDTGWAVGTNGSIAFTSNGGLLWTDQPSGVTATLRHVYVSDTASPANNAIIVGDNGTILKTVDYGTTWEKEPSGTTAALYDVRFADGYNGWIFGENGTILRTTDGGYTWTSQNSGANVRLTGSYFLQRNRFVFHFYQMSLWAQKHHYFVDPVTRVVNRDVLLDTLLGRTLLVPSFQSATYLAPQSYLVIVNDQRKYDNHYQNTYGDPRILSLPTMVDSEIIGAGQRFDSLLMGKDSVLWKLTRSGEVRLERYDINMIVDPTRNQLVYDTNYTNSIRVIDLARWGDFRPNPGDFGDEPVYELNQPLGYVPDWYSIARYSGDVGGDVSQSNTATSFYICDTPVPGQGSQRRK